MIITMICMLQIAHWCQHDARALEQGEARVQVLLLSPPRVSSQSQSVIGNMETPPAAGNVATISSWC